MMKSDTRTDIDNEVAATARAAMQLIAAEAVLAAAGIRVTVVAACPEPGCPVCEPGADGLRRPDELVADAA